MSEDEVNDEAVWKFWKTRELIEKLLLYLDPISTRCLAEAHDLTQKTLLRGLVWSKLLRRAFPHSWDPYWDEGKLEEETPKARALAEILKMSATPKSLQLELLHVICQRSPPGFSAPHVRVRCPCNQNHEVAPLGFILLEEVESTLGSTEQIMVDVKEDSYEKGLLVLLVALGNRASRQQGREFYAHIDHIRINNMETAEAFLSLTEHCELMRFRYLFIKGELGTEGWAVLRQAFEFPNRRDPQWAGMFFVITTSKTMTGGRREDLKAIWDALQDGECDQDGSRWIWNVIPQGCFYLMGREEEWMRLVHTLDNFDLAIDKNEEQPSNEEDIDKHKEQPSNEEDIDKHEEEPSNEEDIDKHEEQPSNEEDTVAEGGNQDEP